MTMRRISGNAFFVLPLLALAVGMAAAQTEPGPPVVYRLGAGSVIGFACSDEPNCVCPTRPDFPMEGTFVLTSAGTWDGFDHYVVSEVNWFGATITGSGTFKIGGDPLMQAMDLDLRERGRYSSGLVPVTVPFPAIDLSVIETWSVCVADVLRVQAAPVPPEEILPYAVLEGSTFRRTQLNARHCPRDVTRPLHGTFALVPIPPALVSPSREYAVVQVRWGATLESGSEIPLQGAGVYDLGVFSGSDQRLRLRLTVNGRLAPVFDSGLVDGGWRFPDIEIQAISDARRRCGDYVIDLVAGPAAP